MFKFLVIVLLCIIALHACADTSLFLVHLPLTGETSLTLVNGTSYHSVNIPVNPFDGYYVKRIW